MSGHWSSPDGGGSSGKGRGPVEATALFPRLHRNDAKKSVAGLRPPPRNKMALYEQVTISSKRSLPGTGHVPTPLPAPMMMQGASPALTYVPPGLYESQFSYPSYFVQPQSVPILHGSYNTAGSSAGSQPGPFQWSRVSSNSNSTNFQGELQQKPSASFHMLPGPKSSQAQPNSYEDGPTKLTSGERERSERTVSHGASEGVDMRRKRSGVNCSKDDRGWHESANVGEDDLDANAEEMGDMRSKFAWWAWNQRHKPWVGGGGSGSQMNSRGSHLSNAEESGLPVSSGKVVESRKGTGEVRLLLKDGRGSGNGAGDVESDRGAGDQEQVMSAFCGARDMGEKGDGMLRREREQDVVMCENDRSNHRENATVNVERGAEGNETYDDDEDEEAEREVVDEVQGQRRAGEHWGKAQARHDGEREQQRVEESGMSQGVQDCDERFDQEGDGRRESDVERLPCIPAFAQYQLWNAPRKGDEGGGMKDNGGGFGKFPKGCEGGERENEMVGGQVTEGATSTGLDEVSGGIATVVIAQNRGEMEEEVGRDDYDVETETGGEESEGRPEVLERLPRRPGSVVSWGIDGPPARHKRQRSPSDSGGGRSVDTRRESWSREMQSKEDRRADMEEEGKNTRAYTPGELIAKIGQKDFWIARRAILRQQKIFSNQLVDLHRLHKVQHLVKSIGSIPRLEQDQDISTPETSNQTADGPNVPTRPLSSTPSSRPAAATESMWPMYRTTSAATHRATSAAVRPTSAGPSWGGNTEDTPRTSAVDDVLEATGNKTWHDRSSAPNEDHEGKGEMEVKIDESKDAGRGKKVVGGMGQEDGRLSPEKRRGARETGHAPLRARGGGDGHSRGRQGGTAERNIAQAGGMFPSGGMVTGWGPYGPMVGPMPTGQWFMQMPNANMSPYMYGPYGHAGVYPAGAGAPSYGQNGMVGGFPGMFPTGVMPFPLSNMQQSGLRTMPAQQYAAASAQLRATLNAHSRSTSASGVTTMNAGVARMNPMMVQNPMQYPVPQMNDCRPRAPPASQMTPHEPSAPTRSEGNYTRMRQQIGQRMPSVADSEADTGPGAEFGYPEQGQALGARTVRQEDWNSRRVPSVITSLGTPVSVTSVRPVMRARGGEEGERAREPNQARVEWRGKEAQRDQSQHDREVAQEKSRRGRMDEYAMSQRGRRDELENKRREWEEERGNSQQGREEEKEIMRTEVEEEEEIMQRGREDEQGIMRRGREEQQEITRRRVGERIVGGGHIVASACEEGRGWRKEWKVASATGGTGGVVDDGSDRDIDLQEWNVDPDEGWGEDDDVDDAREKGRRERPEHVSVERGFRRFSEEERGRGKVMVSERVDAQGGYGEERRQDSADEDEEGEEMEGQGREWNENSGGRVSGDDWAGHGAHRRGMEAVAKEDRRGGFNEALAVDWRRQSSKGAVVAVAPRAMVATADSAADILRSLQQQRQNQNQGHTA